MQPPTDLTAWGKLLPLKYVEGTWREYMAKCTQVNAELTLEPFLAFKGDEIPFNEHEIAHFILCPDNSVLDPYWGIPLAPPINEPDNLFDFNTKQDVFHELRVNVLQEILVNYTYLRKYHMSNVKWYRTQFEHLPPYWPTRRQFSSMHHYTCRYLYTQSAQQVADQIWHSMLKENWTIGKIWTEFQRKTTLVEEAILNG